MRRSKIYFVAASVVLCTAMSCGLRGATSEDVAPSATSSEVAINRDSLLDVLGRRYDVLCEERRVAYAERDSARCVELLRINDERCAAFADSLRWVVELP